MDAGKVACVLCELEKCQFAGFYLRENTEARLKFDQVHALYVDFFMISIRLQHSFRFLSFDVSQITSSPARISSPPN